MDYFPQNGKIEHIHSILSEKSLFFHEAFCKIHTPFIPLISSPLPNAHFKTEWR